MPRETKIFEVSVDPQPEPYPFMLRFTHVDAVGTPITEDGAPVTEDHHFEAMGDPGSAGMALVAASSVRYDDRGESTVDLSGILRLFKRAMPSGDYVRLCDLLDRQDLHIHMDYLVEIYTWLTEVYTGRPTREQRRSSTTPHANGRSLTGSHFSAAAT